jgi:hypothetical protein
MSTQEKLAAARAAKETRQNAAKEAAAAKELALLELEERLEKEHGARGAFFEMFDTVEGPVAVKLGEAVLHTRFQASKMEPSDLHDYVHPCVVHPSKEKYVEIVDRRPAIAQRAALALATLYGVKANEDAGKF